MKMRHFAGVLALSLIAVAAGSPAQGADPTTVLHAKIPFAFTLGDKSFPAGEYTLQQFSNGLVAFGSGLRLTSLNVTSPGGSHRGGDKPSLLFRRYDEQHFLSEVYDGRGFAARRFSVSKLEKERLRANSKSAQSRAADVVVIAYAASR